MIKYEDYDLPCPLLSNATSQEPLGFLRSNFEYNTRQRVTYKGYVKQNFSVICDYATTQRWQLLWNDLHNGADAFNANFMVHANDNINKVVRFIVPFSFTPLGRNIYRATTQIEVLSNGTSKADECPLYPYSILYTNDTLYPC